jgi:hypothetical protein
MKMKTIILTLSLISHSFLLKAQIGKLFPEMKAHKLDEKVVVLPEETKGKYTLLGLAYSKEAEKDLATWYQPVYEAFIFKDKGGAFEVESYDINLYFIPMFTGINQAAHSKISKEMKEGVDKTLWPYILLYKGELKSYNDELAMDDKNIPYFYILDKKGLVVYKTSGKYSNEKMAEIEKHLELN